MASMESLSTAMSRLRSTPSESNRPWSPKTTPGPPAAISKNVARSYCPSLPAKCPCSWYSGCKGLITCYLLNTESMTVHHVGCSIVLEHEVRRPTPRDGRSVRCCSRHTCRAWVSPAFMVIIITIMVGLRVHPGHAFAASCTSPSPAGSSRCRLPSPCTRRWLRL